MGTECSLLSEDAFLEHKCRFSKDESIQSLVSHIGYLQYFLDNLGHLVFGRDIIITRSNVVSTQDIVQSAVFTLKTIQFCCEYGHLADVNVLVRKYRDDLFFYLYVFLGANSDLLSTDNLTKHEQNINRWVSNDLRNLHISDILKYIANDPSLNLAIKKYDMEASFQIIGKKLNNFVHGNGISYYNKWHWRYSRDELKKSVDDIRHGLDYITTVFVFLLTLIKPSCIMSYDYIDSLDCGMNPLEQSQYWVAPFIQEFFAQNKSVLGDDCVLFIREQTGMLL